MQSVFKRRNYLYSLIAGACMVPAFAPLNIFPLAFLSLAALFYLVSLSNRRVHSVMLGWFFGVGLFGVGASWVYQSMHSFAQAPAVLAGFLTLAFVMVLALQIALFGWIISFFTKSLLILRLLLVYPAAWVLVEWFRGWFLTGFPWLYIGHSQSDTWLAHLAPIGGTLLVSWVGALVAAGLMALTNSPRVERYQQVGLPAANYVRTSEPMAHWNRVVGVLFLAILTSISWYVSTLQWTTATDKRIKVSLLQGNIAQDQKWLPEQRVPSVERYMQMTQANWDSDLIVWPETAIPGMFTQFNDFVLEPMQAGALTNNTRLVLGGFLQNEKGQFENSVIVLGDNTEYPDSYSKRHLVPLGEYIPLLKYLRWLERWMDIPYDNLTRGTEDGLLDINGLKAQVSICYEDAFGEEIIQDLPEADFLLNVTNDGWFSNSLQPYQHMQIARMRALETGRYLLRATNTGVSGIVDPQGKLVETVAPYTQGVVTGEIVAYAGSTPYVRFGNYPVVIGISGILLLMFLLVRFNRRIG